MPRRVAIRTLPLFVSKKISWADLPMAAADSKHDLAQAQARFPARDLTIKGIYGTNAYDGSIYCLVGARISASPEQGYSTQDFDPGIEDVHARSHEFLRIAGNHREAMMLGRSRDDQVGLGECMSRFAAVLDQEAPLEHDVFRDRQYVLFEHWPYLVRQPVIQIGSTRCVRQQFDPEAYFGKRNNTDEEPFQGLRAYEFRNFGFGLRPPKLGDDIGVEQPSRHSETSRTGVVVR
jgi:hypothetical protein